MDDVIRLLPGMWQARAFKATLLGEMGLEAEARRLLDEARELGADDPSFWEAWNAMELPGGDMARIGPMAIGGD